jgi:hypothetical protein
MSDSRTIKTSLPMGTYDLLDREAGRQGISLAEMLRRCVTAGLREMKFERQKARLLRDENPSTFPAQEPVDSGAW